MCDTCLKIAAVEASTGHRTDSSNDGTCSSIVALDYVSALRLLAVVLRDGRVSDTDSRLWNRTPARILICLPSNTDDFTMSLLMMLCYAMPCWRILPGPQDDFLEFFFHLPCTDAVDCLLGCLYLAIDQADLLAMEFVLSRKCIQRRANLQTRPSLEHVMITYHVTCR